MRRTRSSPAALLTRDPARWSAADLAALLTAPAAFRPALEAAADDRARARHGREVTYVVNRNVNLTNHCSVRCGFCAFYRMPRSPEAYRKSPEQAVADVAATTPHVTEICLQSGIDDAYRLDDWVRLVRLFKAWRPGVHLHAFSPQEIWSLSLLEGVEVEAVLDRLREAGLDSMPGTAAEVLVPAVRRRVAPRRLPVEAWERVVEAAHRRGLRTSATMMFGHLESPADRAAHLVRIRRLQERTGGFTEFVPMPFLPANTALQRAGRVASQAPLDDVALVTAVSRLYLDDVIANVQASWVKAGQVGAARLLQAGANDLGGTLYEESISRSAGGTAGEMMTPEDFSRVARMAGRVAVERTTGYARAHA